MRFAVLIFAVLLATGPALSQDWGFYMNARFGYVIDIPPGYSGEGEADNGDGQIFNADDGTQLLRVYGANALDGFEAAVENAMEKARAGGAPPLRHLLI